MCGNFYFPGRQRIYFLDPLIDSDRDRGPGKDIINTSDNDNGPPDPFYGPSPDHDPDIDAK